MTPPSLRRSLLGRVFLFAALVAGCSLLAPAVTVAQDPPADPPKAEAPKADPPKADAPATTTKADPEAGLGKRIVYIAESVGVFWLILGPTSLVLMGIVVWLLLDLRGSAAIPAGFVDEFAETVNKRKYKEAYEMAKEDPSYLGRVLTAGMGRLQFNNLDDVRESALNTLDAIKGSKERWNNYLAVIASLGPLLGLVGTVWGMIGAFKALGGGENKNAALLADNIAHALAVTLIGVAIAVPALALNTFFRNRINQVAMDVGHVADDLLTQMYHNSKKATAPVAATAAPVAAPATPPARG